MKKKNERKKNVYSLRLLVVWCSFVGYNNGTGVQGSEAHTHTHTKIVDTMAHGPIVNGQGKFTQTKKCRLSLCVWLWFLLRCAPKFINSFSDPWPWAEPKRQTTKKEPPLLCLLFFVCLLSSVRALGKIHHSNAVVEEKTEQKRQEKTKKAKKAFSASYSPIHSLRPMVQHPYFPSSLTRRVCSWLPSLTSPRGRIETSPHIPYTTHWEHVTISFFSCLLFFL